MSNKLAAAIIITILASGSLASLIPVFAHFTVGLNTPSFAGTTFRDFDFDPHRSGVVSYVWPGGGFGAYSATNLGAFTGAPNGLPPGYQSPWPGGNPPGAGPANPTWYQLEGTAYAPFGAILTSTDEHRNAGDLIFAINFTLTEEEQRDLNANFVNAVADIVLAQANLADAVTALQGGDEATATLELNNAIADLENALADLSDPIKSGMTAVDDIESVIALLEAMLDEIALCAPTCDQDDLDDLADTVGDLIDSLQDTINGGIRFIYTAIDIYIPPEFDLDPAYNDNLLVSSTLTNSYIEYSILSPAEVDWTDAFGPGWWVIHIDALFEFRQSHTVLGPQEQEFSFAEWYYIRIADVGAPQIAGRYFFKFFLWDDGSSVHWPIGPNAAVDIENQAGPDPESFKVVSTENWPALLVKGEIDPAIITGTVRFGGYNTLLYGTAINLPGRVRAVGIADDPYTGESTGRAVEARGYFNATAYGHYEIEGVAPGVYDLYASAAGYPEQLIATGLRVLRGQSYHVDGYINPGPVVSGEIFSKHGFGEQPWPWDPRPVFVEMFDQEVTGNAPEVDPVAYSPINFTHPPYMAYNWPWLGAAPVPRLVAFDWDDAVNVAPAPAVNVPGIAQTPADGSADFGVYNGVGPDQIWWVSSDPAIHAGALDPNGFLTATSFRFQFGVKGYFGVPTELDGHIPQALATWVNGLEAGRYWVRAWINGYVQTELDGSTFTSVAFDVAPSEWAGDIHVPFDLRVTSLIKKTVHFHDLPGTLQTKPTYYSEYLVAEVFDADGHTVGFNFTYVYAGSQNALIQINGLGMAGPDNGAAATNMKYSLLRYRYLRDYGIPSGTYTVRVYMRGYLQQEFEQVSLTLSGSPAVISNHMYRGAWFNVTVYSIDWERPSVQKPWVWQGQAGRIFMIDSKGRVLGNERFQYFWQDDETNSAIVTNWRGPTSVAFLFPHLAPFFGVLWPTWAIGPWFYDVGFLSQGLGGIQIYRRGAADNFQSRWAFDTDTYIARAFTYGYVQKRDFTLAVQKGSTGDIKMQLIVGANITINVKFKKENLFTHVPYNQSVRVRIFNEDGTLVAHGSLGTWNYWDYATRARINRDQVPGPPSDGNYAFPQLYLDPTQDYTGLYEGSTFNFYHNGAWHDSGDAAYEYAQQLPESTTELRIRLAGLIDNFDALGYISGWGSGRIRTRLPMGIDAAPNYNGEWTVEVDFVNWYHNWYDTVVDDQNDVGNDPVYPVGNPWYPPVQGLLRGESFHTIPGSPAGPFGFVGPDRAVNGLGLWAQRGVWTVPNAHLSGEASVIFELDQRGYIRGQIQGFSWSGEFRPLSWTTVTATGADGLDFTSWSWDSLYEMYLNPGAYTMTVVEWTPSEEGHNSQSTAFSVSTGSTSTGVNFYLEQSGIPIPEFGALAVTVLSALAASLYVIRRRRQ